MPNVALRSFQVYGVNDEVLDTAVEKIEEAVKDAKSSGDVQKVSLFRRGYRQDLQLGDIYVVPPSVCDSIETFPLGLLHGHVVKSMNPESRIEIEMGALIDRDAISKGTLADFKDAVFKKDGEGSPKTLLLFRACWSNPHDAVGFLFDKDTLRSDLRDVAYAAPFNPALSSVLDALKSCSDSHASFVISGPVTQHLYTVDKAKEQRYPKLIPGMEYAEEDPKSKTASVPQVREVIRLAAVNITALEQAVLSDDELSLLAAMDQEVGETVTASEQSGLRPRGPLAAMVTAAGEDGEAVTTLNLHYTAKSAPVGWSTDLDGIAGQSQSITAAIREGANAILAKGVTRRVRFSLPLPGEGSRPVSVTISLDRELGDTTPVTNQFALDIAKTLFNRIPGGAKVAAELPATYEDLEANVGDALEREQGESTSHPGDTASSTFGGGEKQDEVQSIVSAVIPDPEAGTTNTFPVMSALLMASAEDAEPSDFGGLKNGAPADVLKGVEEAPETKWSFDGEDEAPVFTTDAMITAGLEPSLEEAVETAYQWHGGQSSALYSFASTGSLYKESWRGMLENEIEHCIDVVKSRPGDYEPDDLERLGNLLAIAQTVPAKINDEEEGVQASAKSAASLSPETSRVVRRIAFHIRNKEGQKWACADVEGLKLGGYWTDDEQEAHDFHNEEEAHEEVRRNCLDDAIVLPKGVGPLKVAGSWWSPGSLLAKAYPALANKTSHVPGKHRSKRADAWWESERSALEAMAPDIAYGNDGTGPSIPGMVSVTEGPVINPFGAPGNGVEQAPVGMAGCPEGLNKMYEGVPLKTENNYYGPEYMREFYAPQTDIGVADISVKHAAYTRLGVGATVVTEDGHQGTIVKQGPRTGEWRVALPGDIVRTFPEKSLSLKVSSLKTAGPGAEFNQQLQQALGQAEPESGAPSLMDAMNAAVPAEEPKSPYIDPQQNGDGLDNPTPIYLMVDKFVKGTVGAYVSQLIAAFNFTQKPLDLTAPYTDQINLEEVLDYGGGSNPTAQKAAKKQLAEALDLLSDDQKKQVVNDASAQAAVWCENSNGSGGFTYEVFARVEAMEGSVLTVKVITGIR